MCARPRGSECCGRVATSARRPAAPRRARRSASRGRCRSRLAWISGRGRSPGARSSRPRPEPTSAKPRGRPWRPGARAPAQVSRVYAADAEGYRRLENDEGGSGAMAHHEHELDGLRVAVLATDMFEQVELTEPWKALEKAGAKLEIVSLEEGEIQGFNHYDKADKFKVDRTVEEVSADDYDAYLQPGGVGNPDALR